MPAGQPPKRLQGADDENIQDVMARVQKVAGEREEQRLANDSQYQELAKKQAKKHRGKMDDGVAAADRAADV